jgi:hypothetical protein
MARRTLATRAEWGEPFAVAMDAAVTPTSS